MKIDKKIIAVGGGLQSFNRKAIPTKCLHTNCLKNPGQLQHPSRHFSSSFGISTAQTLNDTFEISEIKLHLSVFLNWSIVFHRKSLYISTSFKVNFSSFSLGIFLKIFKISIKSYFLNSLLIDTRTQLSKMWVKV